MANFAFNGTSIDTKFGPRLLQFVQGDILSSEDDIITFSTHAKAELGHTGYAVNSIEAKYNIDLTNCESSRLVVPRGVFGTWEIDIPGSSQKWLMVRVPGAKSIANADPLDVYNEALWTLFSSVAALELRGERRFRSMSMTFLGGTRGYGKKEVLSSILAASAEWLRISQWMESVSVYTVNTDEKARNEWSQALDSVLGRVPLSLANRVTLNALRDELVSLISGSSSLRTETLAPIATALRNCLNEEPIVVEIVAANGRKLAEALVTEMLVFCGMKFEKTKFMENIDKLRGANLIAPWSSAYFHSLRILGNEGVHYRGKDPAWIPSSLSSSDAVTLLASMLRIIELYESIYLEKMKGNKTAKQARKSRR